MDFTNNCVVSTIDVQRLMALSLGKISASRHQRGGINLHRSLLVAGVVYRTRSAILMDNYRNVQREKLREEKELSRQAISVDCDDDETTVITTTTPDNSFLSVPLSNTFTEKEELSSGMINDIDNDDNKVDLTGSTNTNHSTTNSNHHHDEDKENQISLVTSSSLSTSSALSSTKLRRKASKKRRLDNVDSGDCDSSSESDVTTSKRRCVVAETQTCDDDAESMQVETTQISSLVQCFNTGFTGLLSNVENNCQGNGDVSQTRESQVKSSSSSKSYCSQQLQKKETNFEKVSSLSSAIVLEV